MAVTNPFTATRTVPYLTVDELSNAPMSRNIEHYFPNANSTADQTAQLANLIMRASAAVNSWCNQPLHAHVSTETGRPPIVAGGKLAIHPRHWPIRSVASISIGDGPQNLVSLDLTNLEIQDWRLLIPLYYPWRGSARQGPFTSWTYTAGYPHSTLTAGAAIGATTLQTLDATAMDPGTVLTVEDEGRTEQVTVVSSTGNTVTVTPTLYPHGVGSGVSALPEDIKHACLILIDAGLEFADTFSLTITANDDRGGLIKSDRRTGMLMAAQSLLAPYRRVR